MPKVSVVIPAYNAMNYLPKTLESVLQQTFTDFEVLIVNDGSSDQIVEWVDGVTDLRVKLISQRNQGVSTARNIGIGHAQGEYVAFLDADDLWEPTKLEKQVHYLADRSEVGLVYTWTTLIDTLGEPTGRVFASLVEGHVWKQLIENDMISTGSSTMIRRSCFDEVGVFDPSLAFAEDWDMWLRIAACYSFGVVKEPLTFYRQHPNNATKNRQKMMQSLRIVIEKTFQSVPLDLLHLRNRAYANFLLGLAWLAIDIGDYKQAIHYRNLAFQHHPRVCFSEKFVRLSVAIAMQRLFGPHGYDGVRNLTHHLHQRLLGFLS